MKYTDDIIGGALATRARSKQEEADQREMERRRERWHLGKEIPIALVAAVLVQTFGGIWWMAQLSSKIDNAIATIAEFKNERYTREDARRDRELQDQKLLQLQAVDREVDRRMANMESHVDRLEHSLK